jgi:hypothetical protein
MPSVLFDYSEKDYTNRDYGAPTEEKPDQVSSAQAN